MGFWIHICVLKFTIFSLKQLKGNSPSLPFSLPGFCDCECLVCVFLGSCTSAAFLRDSWDSSGSRSPQRGPVTASAGWSLRPLEEVWQCRAAVQAGTGDQWECIWSRAFNCCKRTRLPFTALPETKQVRPFLKTMFYCIMNKTQQGMLLYKVLLLPHIKVFGSSYTTEICQQLQFFFKNDKLYILAVCSYI